MRYIVGSCYKVVLKAKSKGPRAIRHCHLYVSRWVRQRIVASRRASTNRSCSLCCSAPLCRSELSATGPHSSQCMSKALSRSKLVPCLHSVEKRKGSYAHRGSPLHTQYFYTCSRALCPSCSAVSIWLDLQCAISWQCEVRFIGFVSTKQSASISKRQSIHRGHTYVHIF